MCKVLEEMVEQGVKQGIKQGEKRGLKQARKEFAQFLLNEGKYTLEQIAETSKLPLSEVKKLQARQTS